jgi:hypothetical protein
VSVRVSSPTLLYKGPPYVPRPTLLYTTITIANPLRISPNCELLIQPTNDPHAFSGSPTRRSVKHHSHIAHPSPQTGLKAASNSAFGHRYFQAQPSRCDTVLHAHMNTYPLHYPIPAAADVAISHTHLAIRDPVRDPAHPLSTLCSPSHLSRTTSARLVSLSPAPRAVICWAEHAASRIPNPTAHK